MAKALAAVVLGLAAALATGAQRLPTPTSQSLDAERAGVASAVARYVNAISCGGVRVTPADVLVLSRGYPASAAARYAVLWTGDMACAGAEKTQLAMATFNGGQYVVQPELSSPVAAFESPVRQVTRIVSYGARILVLEGREPGPGDTGGAPSVPVRFMLRADGKGNWVLVDKVFLADPGQ